MARDQAAASPQPHKRQKRPGAARRPATQRARPAAGGTPPVAEAGEPKPEAAEPAEAAEPVFPGSPLRPKPLVEKVLQEARAHLDHQLRALDRADLDALRNEEVAHASRLANAVERLREFDAIRDVAENNAPIDENLDALLETTSAILGSQAAALLLLDADGEQLWPRASIGFRTTLAVKPEPVRGIIWDLVRTGTPVIIPDLRPEQQFRAGLLEEGIHSVVAVPMRIGGAVGGVLVCGHHQTNWFGPSDAELLQIIAGTIGAGFERARSIESQTRRRRRSERTSSFRSDLLNMAAHDIKTPLSTLTLQLHLLGDPNVPEEKRQRALATMKRSIARMTMMLEDFLDLARAQGDRLTVQPRMLKVKDLLDEVAASFRLLAREHGIVLDARSPAGDLEVLADERRILQVLNNLVSNAIRFSGRGGSIRMEVQDKADLVEFRVTDQGRGLAPQQIARLFQPFVQVHDQPGSSKGTGLGLYLSKAIVEAHGGRIWLESAGPGRGTDAVFTLPKRGLPPTGKPTP